MSDANLPAPSARRGNLTNYDPERGLKEVAVAGAAQRHYTRAARTNDPAAAARDRERLYEAVEAKIRAQAEYIVWRDSLPGFGQHGGDHKSDQIAPERLDLPAADPGKDVAYRWRRSYCVQTNEGTAIEPTLLAEAIRDAQEKCIRAVERGVKTATDAIIADWTDSELARKSAAENGEAVIANLHEGADEALLAWAEDEGRLLRIDRRSPFGNPFVMPDDGDRDEVISKFEKFYWPHKPELLRQVPEHAGKVLACWCYPERCHGHIIAETINRVAAGEGTAEEIAEEIANHDG